MIFFLFVSLSLFITENVVAKYVPSKEAGEALILTPLLKNGEIDVARQKSEVVPLLPNIFSHSGYFTVNETTNSNLFFWFFKQSSANWTAYPVILWLQGGPGSSSMFGLFTENGPFKIKNDTLIKSKFSWTTDFNVIYIDNPIGVGYSFTTDYYVISEEEVGQHLHNALTQFFQLFPELRNNKFIVSGESYAGKYVPAVAYEVYKTNPTSEFPINLKGLFIGNGFSDPENMHKYAEHLHRLGILDYRQKQILQKEEERVRILIRSGLWGNASYTSNAIFDTIGEFSEFSQFYDYIREKFDGGDTYIKFMENDRFRNAIHVGKTKYSAFSRKVYSHLENDVMKSVKPWVEELLKAYPIMFFSGQLDIIVAHYLTTEFIEQLHWSGADGYHEAPRQKWYVGDHLAGYFKTYGNLKKALIRGAGHMVPAMRPLCLLDLLNKFVNNEM